MKIRDLILQLTEIYLEHGDINVYLGQDSVPLVEVEHVPQVFNGDPHSVELW